MSDPTARTDARPLVTPPAAGPEVIVTPPPAAREEVSAVAATSLARFERGEGHGVGALLAVSADGHRLVSSPVPDSRTADGYLRMTARILVEGGKRAFRTIGVISAQEGEGRSAAAVNLAVCLGRTKGREGRVLLVDGDSRRRALTAMFCGPSGAGGTQPIHHPALIGTALDGVDLMTAPRFDDGLAIAAPKAWSDTFAELGGAYAHIIVDCPAVIDSPEGLVLRECVDQLILVLRAGRTPRRMIERTLGSLSSKVIGVILNGDGASRPSESWA
jgi:Mrp family chromosome partitioning ATPase